MKKNISLLLAAVIMAAMGNIPVNAIEDVDFSNVKMQAFLSIMRLLIMQQ